MEAKTNSGLHQIKKLLNYNGNDECNRHPGLQKNIWPFSTLQEDDIKIYKALVKFKAKISMAPRKWEEDMKDMVISYHQFNANLNSEKSLLICETDMNKPGGKKDSMCTSDLWDVYLKSSNTLIKKTFVLMYIAVLFTIAKLLEITCV